MTDFSHLSALQSRIHRERQRAAKCHPKDLAWRLHNVAMIEREIAEEYAFLRMTPVILPEMTDDELSAELSA